MNNRKGEGEPPSRVSACLGVHNDGPHNNSGRNGIKRRGIKGPTGLF